MGRRRRRADAAGSKTDKDQGARFHALAALSGTELLDTYLDIFCTGKRDKPRKNDRHQARSRRTIPTCASGCTTSATASGALVQQQRAVEARDRSVALFTIAARGDRRASAPRRTGAGCSTTKT